MGKILTHLCDPCVSRSSCACTGRRGAPLLEGSPQQSSQHVLVKQELCTVLQAASFEYFFFWNIVQGGHGKHSTEEYHSFSSCLYQEVEAQVGLTVGVSRHGHKGLRMCGTNCWSFPVLMGERRRKILHSGKECFETDRADLTSEFATRVFQPAGRLRVSRSLVLGLRGGLAGAVPRAQRRPRDAGLCMNTGRNLF